LIGETGFPNQIYAEFFVVRGLRVSDLTVTEGQLLVVEPTQLAAIDDKLTPSARIALDVFYNKA
jgi:8-oxo-dGTP diphosphatase